MAGRTVTVTLQARASQFIGEINKAASSVDQLGQRLAKGGEYRQAWDQVASGMMTVGAATLAGVGVAVKTFADFDKAMSSVAATGADARSNLDALRETAIQVGADTAFSAREAAGGMEELLKAGVSAEDVIGGGLKGAMDLAAAGALEVGAASEIAATAMTQFGLSGRDVPHIADLIAAGAGKAQGSVHDMGMALKQSGLVASQFGLSIEETAGSLAAFASYGLIGSDAGTSFKTMLLSLANPSKESAQLMKELGISAYDVNGNFVGMEALAGQLKTQLAGLTQAQRDQALAQIFGSDAVRAANVLYQEGAEGVAEWTAAVNEAGYAAETAATMQDNLAGDLEKLGGSLESLFLTAGSGGNDFLRGLVQSVEGAVDALGTLPPAVSQGAMAVAAVGGMGALAVGGFMKVSASVADTVSAFATLKAEAPRAAAALRSVATAGVGLMAIAGIIAVFDAISDSMADAAVSASDLANALVGMNAGGGLERMNAELQRVSSGRDNLEGLGDAMQRVANPEWTNGVDRFFHSMGIGTSLTLEAQTAMQGLDQSLARMNQQQAAQSFAQIAAEAQRLGISAKDLKDNIFPQYAARVQEMAQAHGYSISSAEEWVAIMSGQLPPALQATMAASEEGRAALQELGAAAGEMGSEAQKAANDLMGLSNAMLGLSGSQISVEQAIADANEALKENGRNIDITTAAGRDNVTMLNNLAGKSKELITTLAEQGKSQEEQAAAVARARGEYERLAQAMGFNAEDARRMAAAHFATIPGMTGMGDAANQAGGQLDAARAKAEGLGAMLAGLPEYKSIRVDMPDGSQTYTTAQRLGEVIKNIPDDKFVTLTLSNGETVTATAAEIRAGIEQIPNFKEAVLAINAEAGKGEIVTFQSAIDATTGKTVVVGTISDPSGQIRTQVMVDSTTGKVVEVGTSSDTSGQQRTQRAVDGTTGKTVVVATRADTSGAAAAQAAVNAVRGKTVYITTVQRTIGVSSSDRFGGVTRADGGIVPSSHSGPVPAVFMGAQRFDGGGMVGGWSPHARADNIPAWLTAREVVMSNKAGDAYGRDHLLAMNAGLVDRNAFAAFMHAQGFNRGGLVTPSVETARPTRAGATIIINNPTPRNLADDTRRAAAYAAVGA